MVEVYIDGKWIPADPTDGKIELLTPYRKLGL
jgi:transglutaminase-like putative cysteine protease